MTHELGTTEVPIRPERIVSADYDTTATMIALGARPVGAGDLDVNLAYLLGKTEGIAPVSDVDGLALERIVELDPDLVIGPRDKIEDAYSQLQQIAPTVVVQSNDWRSDLRFVAEIAAREAAAEQIITEHDRRIADLARRLQARAPGTVSILRYREAATFELYGRASAAGTVLDELQLDRPAYETGTEDQLESLSLELIGEFGLADTIFMIVGFVGDGVTGRELDELAGNPLWERVPAVQAGRVFTVDPANWIESSPLAIDGVVDDIERTLLA